MRYRLTLAVVLALALAGSVAAQFADTEVPGRPCDPVGLKGAVSAFPFEDGIWMAYTCNDDRVFLRQVYGRAEMPTAPTPEVTCPGVHPACALLPPGTYGKDWADTVSR